MSERRKFYTSFHDLSPREYMYIPQGSLEVGKQADIAIFDIPNYRYLPYHYGVNHVEIVIKKGKVVYRRSLINDQ